MSFFSGGRSHCSPVTLALGCTGSLGGVLVESAVGALFGVAVNRTRAGIVSLAGLPLPSPQGLAELLLSSRVQQVFVALTQ